MAAVQRVVVPVDSMDPQSWAVALAYAVKISAEVTPRPREVVLLTHTKDQLNGTSLSGYLSDAALKALSRGESATVPGGLSMRHITMRTASRSLPGAIVIAFYADASLLDFVDGLPGPVGIVAVPDLAGGAEGWRRQWNATVYGEAPRAEEPLIDDPVGVKALEELSRWINLGNALLNPRDKDHADGTLRILRAKDHRLDPEQVKSWAIRNGWPSGAAQDLARLAQKIGALARKPSLSGIHDPEGAYARWTAP